MKKRKIMIPIILILALNLIIAGCDNGDVSEKEAAENTVQVNGTVAVNRQGEGDQRDIKVAVDGEDISVTTDEKGNFSLNLTKGETYDLVATRGDLATTRVQELYIDEDNPLDDIKIMIQKPKNSEYADSEDKKAPEITVKGLKNFAQLNVSKTITVESDKGIRQYYVDLNDNYGSQYENLKEKIEIPNKEFPINYGGDIQTLVIAVVDQFNNITQKIYQMKMPAEEDGFLKPEVVNGIQVISKTYNTSINLLNYPEIGPQTMPEDTMLSNLISWPTKEDAHSYNIYRSFNGGDYKLIDTVKENGFVDVSPSLEVGKKTWYKVSAVNQAGEGDFSPAAFVIPLPVYEITLEGPEDSGVSITPDLEWSSNQLDVEDLKYEYEFGIKDTNTTFEDVMFEEVIYWEEDMIEINSVNVKEDLGFSLERGTRYEWNIISAMAQKSYIEKNNVYSAAVTYGAYADYGLYPGKSSMTFETLK